MTREDALALANSLIEVSPGWDVRTLEFQRGYFNGLTGAYHQAGLISDAERDALREKLAAALRQRPTPPWWDIAARLGL